MTYGNIDREQLFKLAGITGKMYTPVTVGKNNKTVRPKNIWGDQFCNLNFTNLEELRAIQPENVTSKPLFTMTDDGKFVGVSNNARAIVGDDTGNTYAIHSDKYDVVQHSVITDAMAFACEDTNLSVFGHFDEERGRFNGYGSFANPDVHIDLGECMEDPVMLGMRFYNSHNGDSRFGGEIFGLRMVCGNYMAWGDILGKVSIKHFKTEEKVADELGKILRGFVDKIDALKDRVHYIRDVKLDLSEQEALLWGIGVSPLAVENMMTYRQFLNPEIEAESISAFDIYNVGTAYITYKVGSSHSINHNLRMSDKVQSILTEDLDEIIGRGERAKTKYLEELDNFKSKSRIQVVA